METLRSKDDRKPHRIFYLTAGERKAGMIFAALEARYRSVTVAFEHDARQFTFRIADEAGVRTEAFELPRLPRYPKLAWQWWKVARFFRRTGRREPFDLSVGEGIQFILMMPYLRRLKCCRRFVYYAQDWFPASPFLQRLDRYCVRQTDATWDICARTGQARRAHWGNAPETRTLEPLYQPVQSLKKAVDGTVLRCIYVGGIRRDVGLDLFVEAMARLSFEGMQVHLDVVGRVVDDGVREDLARLAETKQVAGQLHFTGFVDTGAMVDLLSRASCGLAIFTGGLSNYSNWAIIGKVREYIENGVPVIISRDNPMADEIVAHRAGFAVGDSVDDVADALRFLSRDRRITSEYCVNAHRLALEKASPAHLYQAIEDAAPL